MVTDKFRGKSMNPDRRTCKEPVRIKISRPFKNFVTDQIFFLCFTYHLFNLITRRHCSVDEGLQLGRRLNCRSRIILEWSEVHSSAGYDVIELHSSLEPQGHYSQAFFNAIIFDILIDS